MTINSSSPNMQGSSQPPPPDFDIPAITLTDHPEPTMGGKPIPSLDDKGEDELREMLRQAFQSVREKEKDLTMAAEIGRNLVTANEQLKRKYDTLLRQSRRSSRSSFTVRLDHASRNSVAASAPGSGTCTPVPYSGHALTTDEEGEGEGEGDDDLSHAESRGSEDEDGISHLPPSTASPLGFPTGSALSLRSPKRPGRMGSPASAARYESEMVRMLEERNSELQVQLEAAQGDLEHTHKVMGRRIRKLEADLSSTRRELDRATDRCTELEGEVRSLRSPPGTPGTSSLGLGRIRSRASQRSFSGSYDTTGASKPGDGEGHGDGEEGADGDEGRYMVLRRKCADLESAHTALVATKRIVNDRLSHTQSELRASKLRCADLESKVRALEHMEVAYGQQGVRVEMLERALEEQRRWACGEGGAPGAGGPMVLVGGERLGDDLTGKEEDTDRSPDMSAEGLVQQERKIQDEYERGMTLMDELEMVLFNANQLNDSSVGVDNLFKHSMGVLGGASATGTRDSGGEGSIGGSVLDELVGAVGGMVSSGMAGAGAVSASAGTAGDVFIAMEEDRSFFGLVRGVFRMIYRWVRFMCVLWAAVVLTVARGPRQRIKQA
ncbi:hypothetical protein BJ684DRAFT_19909 [Piptocephalis cylindrospora]|uniref:Uncharacterized protein n=1 Tax=Piptocephalis cylindrospora TaxID=1907219 RepID=A0A4V1IY79_9FUNG|nr:hypothetical protein BJ684DRAFT_19909 [Piptocephalis cylindrospora]|eukprot:RKP13619.1 hypothetical protein BJ684DRAFT_19909 [Piptocephalis cylindrospora]